MEKGEMRVELNLSVSDTDVFGTKFEVKNINSFRAVEKAARFEIDRHIKLLEEGRGDEIVQETRGWDENKEITFSQRKKENSEDYRYFPEPDLPKVYLHELFDLEKMRGELPELPSAKRERYLALGIKSEDVEVLISDREVGGLFEKVSSIITDKETIKKAVNYITTDLAGLRQSKEDFKMPEVDSFVSLIKMVGENKVNSRGAKDILAILVSTGGNPEEIAKEKGLLQESNTDAIKEIVQSVINANEKVVADFKAGNENSLKFLMGQVMKESKGSANPQIAQQILTDLLK
jgi:aspartyl-tRNA(Asn)/glutamyl-tRNA(Gln) amidotransferase subunit B